jgi:uncharacterized protein YbjT (DUF2867 family)
MAQQGMATDAYTLIRAGAQTVYGDLRDRASLDAACSGVDTVVTPANTALLAQRPVTLVGKGDQAHMFVSLEDVANFAVAAVENPSAVNQTIQIGGTLTPIEAFIRRFFAPPA